MAVVHYSSAMKIEFKGITLKEVDMILKMGEGCGPNEGVNIEPETDENELFTGKYTLSFYIMRNHDENFDVATWSESVFRQLKKMRNVIDN